MCQSVSITSALAGQLWQRGVCVSVCLLAVSRGDVHDLTSMGITT